MELFGGGGNVLRSGGVARSRKFGGSFSRGFHDIVNIKSRTRIISPAELIVTEMPY